MTKEEKEKILQEICEDFWEGQDIRGCGTNYVHNRYCGNDYAETVTAVCTQMALEGDEYEDTDVFDNFESYKDEVSHLTENMGYDE